MATPEPETTDQATRERLMAAVAAAKAARLAAEATEEQAVRDAVAEGLTPSDAARALDTKNRQRVYAILGRGNDGADPTAPDLTPVAYLRGAGMSSDTWQRVESALHARGLVVIRDRTTAWHLARGGAPVVLVDMSLHPDMTGVQAMVIGKVRARWQERTAHRELTDLVTTSQAAALIRAEPDLAKRKFETTEQEMDLQRVTGGKIDRPMLDGHLDAHTVARYAVAALN